MVAVVGAGNKIRLVWKVGRTEDAEGESVVTALRSLAGKII